MGLPAAWIIDPCTTYSAGRRILSGLRSGDGSAPAISTEQVVWTWLVHENMFTGALYILSKSMPAPPRMSHPMPAGVDRPVLQPLSGRERGSLPRRVASSRKVDLVGASRGDAHLNAAS